MAAQFHNFTMRRVGGDGGGYDIHGQIRKLNKIPPHDGQELNEILKKRNNSPRAPLFAQTSEIYNILTEEISGGEVRRAIISRKDNKYAGNDNIPTEIFKRNLKIWTAPVNPERNVLQRKKCMVVGNKE